MPPPPGWHPLATHANFLVYSTTTPLETGEGGTDGPPFIDHSVFRRNFPPPEETGRPDSSEAKPIHRLAKFPDRIGRHFQRGGFRLGELETHDLLYPVRPQFRR